MVPSAKTGGTLWARQPTRKLHSRPEKHSHRWGYWIWKNHDAQCPRKVHPIRRTCPPHRRHLRNSHGPGQPGPFRGGEAFDLLQLLNTGHSGSLSTVHATSARQGLARFTSCVLQSGVDLPYRAIKTNVGDSVNVVVHLERRPGRRFVSEVVEIHGYDPDRDEYNYSFIFDSHKEPL